MATAKDQEKRAADRVKRAAKLAYPRRHKSDRASIHWDNSMLDLGPWASMESLYTLFRLKEHLADGGDTPVMKAFRQQVMEEFYEGRTDEISELKESLSVTNEKLSEAESSLSAALDRTAQLSKQNAELTAQLEASHQSRGTMKRWLKLTSAACVLMLSCSTWLAFFRSPEAPRTALVPAVDGVLLTEFQKNMIRGNRKHVKGMKSKSQSIAQRSAEVLATMEGLPDDRFNPVLYEESR